MIDLFELDRDVVIKLVQQHIAFIRDKHQYAISSATDKAFRLYEADDVDDIVEDVSCYEHPYEGNVHVVNCDPITCLFNLNYATIIPHSCDHEWRTQGVTIVNPGEFSYPGGGVLTGKLGTEALLCHYSTLYPVLSGCIDLYYSNKVRSKNLLNNYLYQDDILCTGGILFFNYNATPVDVVDNYPPQELVVTVDEMRFANVLTCPPPSVNDFKRRSFLLSDDEKVIADMIWTALYNRIDAMLSAAVRMGATLIIDAYGCERGCDSTDVATIFKDLLSDKYKDCFNHVYFAIADDELFNKFNEVLKEVMV